jgi:hypothetical protein
MRLRADGLQTITVESKISLLVCGETCSVSLQDLTKVEVVLASRGSRAARPCSMSLFRATGVPFSHSSITSSGSVPSSWKCQLLVVSQCAFVLQSCHRLSPACLNPIAKNRKFSLSTSGNALQYETSRGVASNIRAICGMYRGSAAMAKTVRRNTILL